MKNKAAIYVRVSHASQGESGISLNDQISTCIKWCDGNKISYDVYSDVISGSKDNRPQFNLLKENLNMYCKVVVSKVDRLARRLSIAVNFIDLLDNKKIEFISVKDNISSLNYQNRFLLNMLSVAGAFERDQIIDRVNATKAYLKAQNRVAGQLPYGFDSDQDGRLTVNCDEKNTSIRIKNYHRNGESYSEIARILNFEGLKTKKKRSWYPQTVKNIVLSCK